MTVALFSLAGVIIGALLQYLFSKHLEHQRHLRELKTRAYTDYLMCVSEYAHLSRQKTLKDNNLAARTADAKCRTSLYGSNEVIEAFAQFERLGAAMNTSEQREAFTALVNLMRIDSGRNASTNLTNLQILLVGREG